MNHAMIEKIAQAVLYEGYILYPYRPSVKNQQRWTFGGLFPRSYSELHATGDAWFLQTECIVLGDETTKLELKMRFLHLTDRRVGRLREPLAQGETDLETAIDWVESMSVEGKTFQRWQEAVDREVVLPITSIGNLLAKPLYQGFAFRQNKALEQISNSSGRVVGLLLREQHAIEGSVEISAQKLRAGVFKISVRVLNQSSLDPAPAPSPRDHALMRSLVSTHAIIGVVDGQFVSMTDPPDEMKDAVEGCRNIGVWPVLVGEVGSTDAMLASPIILYDYPQIAPESPGDLFDGTEIDEILTLRVMTLTDEEKRQASAVDERAHALLKRTETLAREQLMNLHGTMRNVDSFPAADVLPEWDAASDRPRLPSIRAGGVDLHPGDRVRLRPRGGADAFDLLLNGKIATIATIEQDYEDRIHLAVTVEDDPGADFGMAGKPGHRFFFGPDEVEPLTVMSND